MLALTRRAGEEIVIGDPCNPLGVIRVVEIHGDKVRLSFDFPRDVSINRRELADQKAKQSGKPAGGNSGGSTGGSSGGTSGGASGGASGGGSGGATTPAEPNGNPGADSH